MSSPHLSGDPSPPPERGALHQASPSELSLASLVRHRGGPLIDALEQRLPGAREHAEATGSYAFAASAALGHDRSHAELVREAAKLHEVGKVYVAAELLAKDPDLLSAAERAELDTHHDAGYRLVRGAGIPDQVCRWVLCVRERFDGTGPEQLDGARIPAESRLIRAACACHVVLAAPRGEEAGPHRWDAALMELRDRAGSELDPAVVGALGRLLDRGGGDPD